MVDHYNQRVCVFRGSDFLRAFGVPREHGNPVDVAVTAAGELLVTCGVRNPQCFVYRAADGAYIRAFAAVAAGDGSRGCRSRSARRGGGGLQWPRPRVRVASASRCVRCEPRAGTVSFAVPLVRATNEVSLIVDDHPALLAFGSIQR